MASSSYSSSNGGFSIREYTADMRSTDITKCLPFGGFAAEEPDSFLPPIRVVKFRWWLDMLASTISRKEIHVDERISLGSVVRQRSSSLLSSIADHDDDHGDDCAAEADVGELRRKKKKKERSIVEIFAVSPRVITRGTRKKKRVEGKMKTKISEAKKVLRRNTHEMSSTPKIDEEPNLKLERKISSKKHKCSESWPNFDAKRQKQASSKNPVRSILKRSSQFSSGQGSEIGPDEFRSLVTSHDIGEKRVKFTISVRDDDGRSDERSSNAVEVIVQAGTVNDNDSDPKRNRSDCKAIIDVEDSPDSSVDQNSSECIKPSVDQPEDSDFLKESGGRCQITNSLDDLLPALDKSTTVAFHGPQYADYSKYLYEIARPVSARANDPIDTSILRYDCHPSFPHPIYSPCQAAMTKAVSELLPDYFAPTVGKNRGPLSFLCGSDLAGASSHPSGYHHPLHLTHPHNLRGSWYGSHTGGLTDKDLMGLPLNSHGELIRVNSGGDHMLCDDRSFPMKDPRDDFRLRMTISGGASDQSDPFRMVDLGGKGPCSFHVARSHARTEVDYCRHKSLEDGSLRGKGVAYMGRSGDCASPNSAPLTMRLMGKDVPVSRSSCNTNGSEDGSIWTDKAVVMEHRSPNCFLLGKHQLSQKWIMQSDSAITKEAECRCVNPHFVWHNGEVSTQRFLHCELPNVRNPNPMASPNLGCPGVSFISNTRPKCHPMCREPVGFGSMQNTRPWISGNFLYPEYKEYSQPSQLPIFSGGLAPFPHPSTPKHGLARSFQSTNVIPPWISVSPASDLGKTSSFYYQPYLDTSMRTKSLSRGENSCVLSSARPPYMPVLTRIGQNPAQRPSYNSHHVNSRDSMRETGIWGKYMGPRIKNLRPKMSHVSSSAELDRAKEAANLGPTKLTAGAKHMLKPSSYTDSVPVHSTIPFAGVTGFVVASECDARSSKIFKL